MTVGNGHRPLQRVGIVGGGIMGSGIAEVCARAGYDTVVREVDDVILSAGLDRIKQSLATGVRRGKLSENELLAMAFLLLVAGHETWSR